MFSFLASRKKTISFGEIHEKLCGLSMQVIKSLHCTHEKNASFTVDYAVPFWDSSAT
ncbi:MAG: hypothetical protein ACJAZ2_001447 [Glaciecola sp.]|jgi:hypothetical protein